MLLDHLETVLHGEQQSCERMEGRSLNLWRFRQEGIPSQELGCVKVRDGQRQERRKVVIQGGGVAHVPCIARVMASFPILFAFGERFRMECPS